MAASRGPFARPLGLIEWDSVAQGIHAADAMIKAAPVEPVAIRPVSPGRFLALFEGDVESVRLALQAGLRESGESAIDSLFLAAPHPGIAPAIGARRRVPIGEAVGIIETLSIASLLVAADGAAKTGEVTLHEIRLAMGLGGKAFCVLSGEVSNVDAAVHRGTELARERGHHLKSVVIPSPDPMMRSILEDPAPPFSDLLV